MSSETNTQTPKRTLEQIEQDGRARARAWLAQHPMMSDDEFEARYDPQGHRDRLLLEALRDLTDAIWHLTANPPTQREQSWRPARSSPPVRPLSGPIATA